MATRLGYDRRGAEKRRDARDAADLAATVAAEQRRPAADAGRGLSARSVAHGLAERYLSPILSLLGTVAIVLVVAIFVLLQQDDLRDWLIRLFGASDLRRTCFSNWSRSCLGFRNLASPRRQDLAADR